MKKIVLVLSLMVTPILMAQQGKQMAVRSPQTQLTAEQRATLETKRLALKLELTPAQQNQLQKVLVLRIEQQKAQREAMKKKREATDTKPVLTADERFAMQNKNLDARLAFQNDIKEILTDAQFAQWKEMQENRKHRFSERRNRNKGGRGRH
ncbi:MAG: hypothetical protein RQ735_03905 [Flavobacteriaceae bacterium]|nr:hypothetical protein [Flavobacteriaceae bacterium]